MAELELYTFACGLDVFRYTDALLPVTYQEKTYAARPIKRGNIEQSPDVEKCSLTITVPLDLPLLDLFRPAAPLRKVLVNVMRTTRGASTARTIFSGTLEACGVVTVTVRAGLAGAAAFLSAGLSAA